MIPGFGFLDSENEAAEVFPDRGRRFASLNCFDYNRLKREVSELKALTTKHGDILTYCPTLAAIMNEALRSESEEYPGRHLSYDHLRGKNAWRFQCLHMLDEILYTTTTYLTLNDLKHEITAMATANNIRYRKNSHSEPETVDESHLPDGTLKKLLTILNEMVCVEYTRGIKDTYHLDAYAKRGQGRIYRNFSEREKALYDITGCCRVSAFAVDISAEEIHKLQIEVNSLRNAFFSNKQSEFENAFPLISILGNIREQAANISFSSRLFSKITETDLLTVNFIPPKHSALKEKVEEALTFGINIPVIVQNCTKEFIPLEIRTIKGQWALIATDSYANELSIIRPEQIDPEFLPAPAHFPIERPQIPHINIIGISELISPQPYKITLELTRRGANYLADRSPLHNFDAQIEYHNVRNDIKYEKGDIATFTAYVNRNLLEEIYRIDKIGGLIKIVDPEEIADLYEEYFFNQHGERRPTLIDRAPSTKYLKDKRKRLSEE